MKLALTADWHLRSKHFQVLRRGPDFTDAAISAVNKSIEAGVVAILNGGDTFHDKRPTTQNIDDLLDINRILQEARMKMFIIDGNHDQADPSWFDTVLDPVVNATAGGGIYPINNETASIIDGDEVVTVRGIPPMGTEAFLAELHALAGSPECPDIILWHGAIREMAGYPDPTTVSIEDMPTNAFRAILCGDIHKRQFTTTGDGCLIGYPGATELSSRDEAGVPRSVTIIDTSGDVYTESEIPIEYRQTHAFQIYSVEQLEEVIEKLQKLPKDPWPIVFVRYDAGVHPHVSERLYNALDNPNAVLRAAPTPKMDAPMFSLKAEGIEVRSPADFVPQFFPHEDALQQLARDLCDPDADHRDLIDRFTDGQLLATTTA